MLEVDTFLDELASAAPIPGGGSVAALQIAMAASLLAMVSNLTIGRKRYADVEDRVVEIRQRTNVLRSEARQLVDEDAAAYGAVSAAMRMSKETDLDKAERTAQIQEALKGAVLPPLESMRKAHEAIELAGELVSLGNRSAVSDVGTAAMAALAGFEAARLNVDINLAAIRDVGWVTTMQRHLGAMPRPHDAVTEIMDRAESVIRGTG